MLNLFRYHIYQILVVTAMQWSMRLQVFYSEIYLIHNKTLPLDLNLLATDLRNSAAFNGIEWSIVRVNRLSIAFEMQWSMRLQVFYS